MISLFLPEQRGAGEDLKMEIIPLAKGDALSKRSPVA
jgi:hypothetical protein